MAGEYVTFEDLVRFHREVIAPDLEARLAPIARQIASIDAKVTSVDARVGSLDARVGSLDGRVGSLDASVGSLDAKVGSLDAKVDALAERLDEGIDAVLENTDEVRTLFAGAIVSLQGSIETGFRSASEEASRNKLEVLEHFDAVFGRLDSMAIEYTALKGGLRRVEERLSKVDGSAN